MDKVRIGFVGCGRMGQQAHIANYASLPDVEMAALADLRPETAKAVARRYGITKVYRTHEELLEDKTIDAVVAIMGFSLHHAVVPDILKAKKHCITEKPICIRPNTARELDDLAKKNGVVYQIAYMKRCDPASVRMKEIIAEWKASQKYGKLKYLRVSMPPGDWTYQIENALSCGDKPEGASLASEGPPEWMDQATGQQYVSFVNYYIHQVNLIRYLLGEDYEIEYADPSGVVIVARSASGVTIVLEMDAYRVGNEWHEFYTACFAKGRLHLSLTAPLARQQCGRLEIYKNEEPIPVYEAPIFPPKWCMREQARFFVDAVKGDRPCISPATDAAKDLEFAESYIRTLT
ncbi:MAG: Gfo/Idh/MocA family oxidoreductase [Planctomycetota bacterium]